MELIIIKGAINRGKTTTAALVHNELTWYNHAKLIWLMLDNHCIPVESEDLVPNFRSAIVYKGKTICIVSHGDNLDCFEEYVNEVIPWYNPDILIVCSRTSGYVCDKIWERFGSIIKDENIFTLTPNHKSADEKDKVTVKKDLVSEIMNRINEICKK